MKILVTGGTGFLGQHMLPKFLETNEQVAVLTRHPHAISQTNLRIIEGSLDNLAQCRSQIKEFAPDVCLHLAWEGIPQFTLINAKKNLAQSIELFDFLLEHTACQKIVVSGSCFEYGKQIGPLPETSIEDNSSSIAWAKNSLKNYLSLHCLETQKSWIWLRIFYVFGPGQRSESLIPSLVTKLRQGLPSPVRNPENANDFIYIEDVVAAIKASCLENAASGIYNVGSGRLTRVSDIWNLIQEKIDSMKKTSATSSRLHLNGVADSAGGYADIQKAAAQLNWKPRWTIEDGIHQTVLHLLKAEPL